MKYDYKKARLYYCRHKNATLKSCSERYSIPFSSLSKKAKKDGWRSEKQKYWEKIAIESKERSAESEVNKLASISRASERAAQVLETAISDQEQFYKYLIQKTNNNGTIDTVEAKFNKLDTKAMRDVVAALKDLISVIRNVDNLPTEAEKLARRIQMERWEAEKRELESRRKNGDSDGVSVSFESEEAELMSE